MPHSPDYNSQLDFNQGWGMAGLIDILQSLALMARLKLQKFKQI